jgi:hypothetical protein
MYEFSLSDPDETLVRVGRRSEPGEQIHTVIDAAGGSASREAEYGCRDRLRLCHALADGFEAETRVLTRISDSASIKAR